MTWLSELNTWLGTLNPVEFSVYVMSPPLLLVGLVAAYFKWRDDHRPQGPHAAE